ncbi:MAG: dockerin type I repeat-containing protein, partial [Clostridia bacterium]|nr:dockerin type I repeat-containing protein [Clostridia bacterium]
FALSALMLLSCAMPVLADDAAGLTLAEGAHLVIDRESGYLDKIDGTITVGELKAKFASAIDIAGKPDDKAVATDDVITAGEDSIKALVYGDVSRDGKVNLGDVTGILKNIAKWETTINLDAADVNKDAKINLADVTKMLKYIAKWDDISLGNVRMIFENTALKAENEDSSLKLSFTSIMNKIGAKQLDHTGEHAYKIKLAKNEYESCTALLYSDTAREGMTAELAPFVSEFGDATLEGKLEWII